MGVTTTKTNKPFNPRGNDQSPKGYNRAKLYSGKALDFDGVSDSVIVPQDSSLELTQGSWSCWFNIDSFGNYLRIIQKGHNAGSNCGYGMALSNAANVVDFWFRTTAGTEQVKQARNLETNTWYFATGTFDGTYVKVYINGIEVTEDSSVTNYSAADTTLTIGMRAGSVASPFDGEISGVRVFNTALTAAQVADLYNNPEKVVPTGLESNLKLWLPMMEGAGTTAYDGSGNGNHGTISGATYVNGIGAPVAQSAVMDWNKGVNIFEHSEEFNDSYWTKARLSITANDIVAPDGQTTADKALENSTTGYRDFGYKSISVTSGQPYTLSAYVKNGLGRDNAYLYTADSSRMAKFNIATGTYIGHASGNGYNAFDSYGIADAGNGWYRIHATLNSSNGGSKTYHLGFSDNTNDVVAPYTGNTSKGLYAWGMQLEQDSSVGPYIPTIGTAQTSPVLLPQGLTTGRDITGVNLFENVRKQGALNLDGNSWAEVHDNASLDVSAFTLEGWIYTNSITSDNRILSKWFSGYPNRTYQFSATNDDLYLYISDGSSSNNTFVLNVLSLNNWYHCVATYDGANLKIYLDGVLKATTASTMTLKDSDQPVYIGAYVGSLDPSDNTTAQPRIYNRALTASEIQQNYNAGKNTYTN